MYYILDEEGNPKEVRDFLTWGKWMEKAERHVAQDRIQGVWISTVFLGLDHSYGRGQTPVLFETMIFGGPMDQSQWRYTTKEKALEGHNQVLKTRLIKLLGTSTMKKVHRKARHMARAERNRNG